MVAFLPKDIKGSMHSLLGNAVLTDLEEIGPITVEAFGYALVIGFADAQATVKAEEHDAVVIVWGEFEGNVEAKESVGVYAQGNADGTLTGRTGAVYVSGVTGVALLVARLTL